MPADDASRDPAARPAGWLSSLRWGSRGAAPAAVPAPVPASPAPGVTPRARRGVLGWMGKLLPLDEPTGYTQATQYQHLLDQLQNSANILNQEQGVRVRWAANGTVNQLASERCVHLDPDDLVDVLGEVDHGRLEALTGRVYLASALCSSVDPGAWAEAQEMRKDAGATMRVALRLWEALELAQAREDLARDWAGFADSLAAEAAEGAASQHDVQAFLDRSARAPDASTAALGMAWNLLHPARPVSLPAACAAAAAEASACMAGPLEPSARARAAYDAACVLVKRLGAPPMDDPSEPSTHDRSLLGRPMFVMAEGLERQVPAEEDGGGMKVPEVEGVEPLRGVRRETVPDRGCQARYERRVDALQPAIRRVVSSLLFNNTDPSFETYGHRRGELDEGSLHKLFMDDDRVMLQRDVRAHASVAVSLLIDESGSMGSDDRYIKARDVAITLYEALRQVRGLQLSVYGHTTVDERMEEQGHLLLREYVTPRRSSPASMMRIAHMSSNLDSWAALEVAQQALADFPGVDRRLLFVISDGAPAGNGYGGKPAIQHMHKVVQACEARGVEIYGLGVANAFSPDHAARMYGPGRCVVLDDVESSAQVITRFLRQVTRAM